MKTRWLALSSVLFVFGCGPAQDDGSPDGAAPFDPSGGGPVATISFAAISGGSQVAKVIVKRSAVVEVPVIDEEGEAGAQSVYMEVFRYVTNVTVGAGGQAVLPIPHGENYTIEVIAGGSETGGVREVLAYYKSALFNVPEITAPAIVEQSLPAVTIPDVFAGLGAPYDKYTVGVTGLLFPFSSSSSVTCSGGRLGPLTFTAPATAGTITCNAQFRLENSLMVTGDSTAWAYAPAISKATAPQTNVEVFP